MFGLSFGLDLLNEWLLNVKRPALSRSRRLIRGAEEMFPLPPTNSTLIFFLSRLFDQKDLDIVERGNDVLEGHKTDGP